MSGPCVVSGQCVHSAHYPKHYGNGERCTLRPVRGQPLRVEAFSTEEGYDYLTINGVEYSGSELITLSRNSIPNSIAQKIIPDRDIFWSSDGSESMSGWLICQESDHQPHMPPWPPHVPPSPPSPPSPPASPPPPLSPPLSELFLGCLRLEDSFVAMLRNGTTLPEALGQGDSDVESIAECHATCAGRASRYFRTFANAEYRELMCECANVSHAISGGGVTVGLIDMPDAECRAECRLEINSALAVNKRCGHFPVIEMSEDMMEGVPEDRAVMAHVQAQVLADAFSHIRMALHAVDSQDRRRPPPPSAPAPPSSPPQPPQPPQPPPGQTITINTQADVTELTIGQRPRLFPYADEAFIFNDEQRIRFPLEALDNGTNEEWSVSLSFKTTSFKGAVDANNLKNEDCNCEEMCLRQVEQGRNNWLGGVGLASWGGPGPGGAYGLSLHSGQLSLGWATTYEHNCSVPPASCSPPGGDSSIYRSCAPVYKSRLEINSSTFLNDGGWHHVAATKGYSGIVTLVVDGAVQGTGSVLSEGLSPPPSRAPSARSAGWLTLGDLCVGGSGKVQKQSNEVPCSSDAANTGKYEGRMKNIAIYDQDVMASFLSPPRAPPPSPPAPPAPPASPGNEKPPPLPLSGGAIAAIVFGGLAGFVLLMLFVLRFRRQSVQLGKMQAPRHASR